MAVGFNKEEGQGGCMLPTLSTKMKELASECWYCWLYTSSLRADMEGVRSSSMGCTPCGKQKCAASGTTGLFSGY
jgi:hypothetical protein